MNEVIGVATDRSSADRHEKSSVVNFRIEDLETAHYGSSSRSSPLKPTRAHQQGVTSHIRGWRKGVYAGILATTIVLLLNISILGYAHAHYAKEDNGTIQLTTGACSKVSRVKVGTHLLINLLATALLSSSNYAMQVLGSPTRQEVDQAHAKRKWLDIGLSSMRNLPAVSRNRLLLWCGLILSSLPLHLVYNSVVFSTFQAYDYHVLVVAPEFLTGAAYSADLPDLFNSSGGSNLPNDPTTLTVIERIRADVGTFERLDKADCIAAYGEPFMTTRSDVVVVTTVHNNTDSLYMTFSDGDLFSQDGKFGTWVCTTDGSDGCLYALHDTDATTWTFQGPSLIEYPADYCLSRPMQSICSVSLYTDLMIVVICCNIAKLVLLMGTLYFVDGTSLVTLGDAVASFIHRPDQSTKGHCLMGRDTLKTWQESKAPTPQHYIVRRRRWIKTIDIGRIGISLVFVAIGLVIVGILLRQVIVQLEPPGGALPSMASIAALGFGNVQSQYYWNGGPSSLAGNILITNLPQVIFSIVYLVYNSLYTCMLAAREWSRFTHIDSPRPLRVTCPQGAQLSTYYLQLPLTFGLPLLAASAIAHWLISQSFYIIAVQFVDLDTNRSNPLRFAAGYSSLAIIIVLILSGVFLLVFVVVGMRRLPATGIPFGGSCSAAISAACHGDADATGLVAWGAVPGSNDSKMDDGSGIGHCAMGSDRLETPVQGRFYM